MKKLHFIIFSALATIGFGSLAFALPVNNYQQNVLPFADNKYDLGTTSDKNNGNASRVWKNGFFQNLYTGSTTSWGPIQAPYFVATSTTATSTFNGNGYFKGNLQVDGGFFAPVNIKVTGMTQGSALFVGPNGVLAQDNANFFWDDTNNRLGIGTAVTNAPLNIQSANSGGFPITQSFASFQTGDMTGGGDISFYVNSIGNSNPLQSIRSTMEGGSGGVLQFLTSSNYVTTAPTVKLTINSAGYVGINDTTPIDLLEVRGAIHTSGAAAASQASEMIMDYFSGGGRILLDGGDASTNATFNLLARRSDGSNSFTILSSNTSGHTTIAGSGSAPAIYAEYNGNVGIGTNAPAVKMHIYQPTASTNAILRVENLGSNNEGAVALQLKGRNANADSKIFDFVTFNSGGNTKLLLRVLNDAEDTATSWAEVVRSGMTITTLSLVPTNGKVAIGTSANTAVGEILLVRASGTSAGTLEPVTFFNKNSSSKGGSVIRVNDTQVDYGVNATAGAGNFSTTISSLSAGNPVEGIRVLSSGNVGIGTAAPKAKLDVQGLVGVGTNATYPPLSRMTLAQAGGDGNDAPTTISLTNNYLQIGGLEYGSSAYHLIGFGYSDPNNTYFPAYIGLQDASVVAGQTKGDLVFGTRDVTTDTQPSERMRITSAGNVGIMTTAPDRALEINSATGINLRLTYNDANGSAANYADLLTSSSGDLTITPSGGDVILTTAVAVTHTGSANNRAKENIILYGATTDAATAVELTSNGAAGSGATNRVCVPTDTALSVVLNIAVKQSASANAKQMLRQFIISNNGGTTAIQGTVVTLGTDSGSAGLTTVTSTITANDTDDCVKVEVNGVAATNLRYSAYLVSTEVLYP